MKVQAIKAFCAVGPGGLLDIDLVRRSQSAAQWAAGAVSGDAWPRLAAAGWTVIEVRIGAANDEAGAPAARKATLPPAGLRAPGRGMVEAVPGSEITSPAPAARPAVSSSVPGRMKLLRAGVAP